MLCDDVGKQMHKVHMSAAVRHAALHSLAHLWSLAMVATEGLARIIIVSGQCVKLQNTVNISLTVIIILILSKDSDSPSEHSLLRHQRS